MTTLAVEIVKTAVSARPLRTELEALPGLDELGEQWCALEPRSDCSFFTSWNWTGSWLATLPELTGLRLLRVTAEGETVALAIVSSRRRSWRAGMSLRGLFFHVTGDDHFDRITPEHNDLLCVRQHAVAVRRELIGALNRLDRGWDELHLPGVTPYAEWTEPLPAGVWVEHRREEESFAVDLDAVRAAGAGAAASGASVESLIESHLGLLSANTRSQVRRSIKEVRKLGEMQLIEAASVEEALRHLRGLRDLHQSCWVARGEPGAFGHPYFEAFHTKLIETAHPRGEVQLLKLQAGDSVLGYLYNFKWRGRILNYQSGFAYDTVSKHARPGLVAHALAVAVAAQRGEMIYDFMAGANRTKESLANRRYQLDWIVLRRARARFRLEAGLKMIKQRLGRPAMAAVPVVVAGAVAASDKTLRQPLPGL